MLRANLQSFLMEHLGPEYLSQRYVLALSGGLDSTVLYSLFRDLLPQSQLIVAHYQHGVRGLEAEGDALFVESLALRFGHAFELGRRPSCKTDTDEASLRADRREFLEKVARKTESDWVVTAHHLNDQAETLIMRLIRGTGVQGLGGIAPVTGQWLRPLLGVSKLELQEFAVEHQLEFREDLSNQNGRYFRNRIRSELLPKLCAIGHDFGGERELIARLGALAEEARETETALEEQTRSLTAQVATSTRYWTRVDKSLYTRLPRFWGLRVLRRVARNLGLETWDRNTLIRLSDLILSSIPSASLPGVFFRQSCGFIYLQTTRQCTPKGRTPKLEDLGMEVASLDPRLEVRFFHPGDRYRGKKLKELFLMWRIPQPERHLLPLMAVQGSNEVTWIYPQFNANITMRGKKFPFAPTIEALRPNA